MADRQEGKLIPTGGTHNTLGRGVLPLTEAAQLIMDGSSELATVKMQLE